MNKTVCNINMAGIYTLSVHQTDLQKCCMCSHQTYYQHVGDSAQPQLYENPHKGQHNPFQHWHSRTTGPILYPALKLARSEVSLR